MSFTPSIYQQKIIDWALDPKKKHGICNAVAGSGKSSTLKLVAMALNNSVIHHEDIKIIVFAKQNQIDLVKKFPYNWKNSISTLHSVGYQIINKTLGKINQVTDYKYKKIARDLKLLSTKDYTGFLLKEKAISSQTQFLNLFDLARLNLSDFIPESLEAIAFHHNLDELYNFELIGEAMEDMNEIGFSSLIEYGRCDYTDLIYQAVSRVERTRIRFVFSKIVLVDECQDLNRCQLELSKRLISDDGRLLYVGDPFQAIYGFAGAGCDSFSVIKEDTKAEELPLSLCYRCPSSHIELVRDIFPEIPIEAYQGNEVGSIELIEEDNAIHSQNDLILSRRTASLVSYCLKLVAQGLPAKVRGRDIGNQLVKEINSVWDYARETHGEDVEFTGFLNYIGEYQYFKEKQWVELDYGDRLAEILSDKLMAIVSIYDSLSSVPTYNSLKEKTQELFSNERAYINLSTVHRAKGLEADTVYILEPDMMPLIWRKQQPWEYRQELNLLYVALTRSKSKLYLMGDAFWLKDEFVNSSSDTSCVTN